VRQEIFRPYSQAAWPSMTVTAKTWVDPLTLVPAAKAALSRIDPEQPVSRPRTMDSVVTESIGGRRFPMLLLALFAAVATLYFATFSGVTASNDGSHYALVRALVSRRSFEISPFLSFTEEQDFATGPGGRYSDRPPGTALWAAPFYAVARLPPGPLVELPSKHDRGNGRLLGIGVATALAGAGAVALFWLLLRRRFGRSLFASGLAALALALGTATWKYGSVLYSHSLSALLVLTGLYLALARGPRPPARAALLGLVLGASVVVEYSNALYVAIVLAPVFVLVGLVLAWRRWDERRLLRV
jgi:hypothetical protein